MSIRFRNWAPLTVLIAALLLPSPDSARAEDLPGHVSYSSLCCLIETLKSDGIKFTFETGEIQQLDDKAISHWEGRTFLFMKPENARQLFSMKIQSARQRLQRQHLEHTTVEFQRLRLGKRSFLLSVYSTSPVSRATAVWTSNAEFRFSVQGDLLAVDPPNWKRKTFRLYFWNPTGSDLAIVDYTPEKGIFDPILAVFHSDGTFSDGSKNDPFIPVMRKQYNLEESIELFDHFSSFRQAKGTLKARTNFWLLANQKEWNLIAYRMQPDPSRNEKEAVFQPETFFAEVLFTTAWIRKDLD